MDILSIMKLTVTSGNSNVLLEIRLPRFSRPDSVKDVFPSEKSTS